ncbi:MAG: hypothetical protein LC774_06260, partial [Acidobacteria bacterium]|nr:hypothetical protein [Acidobacteriota bacterium]
VNPSATEFTRRGWSTEIDTSTLYARLITYFLRQGESSHSWFAPWSEALTSIGMSYENNVAHIDLSPRATRSMRDIMRDLENRRLFMEMLESDATCFFELLPYCQAARVLLLAGCAGSRYMNDLVAKMVRHYGYVLEGSAERRGEGRVGFYRLRSQYINLPVFFCSVSPSDKQRNYLLIERIRSHRDTITQWLEHSATKASSATHV